MEEHYITTIVQDQPSTITAADVPWPDASMVAEDSHVRIYRDGFPVTPGHMLFVPRYNTTPVLAEAFSEAFRYARHRVEIGEWDGFNIGMNYGEAAGQTVQWPHIHVIPRRHGDVEEPRGGVRNLLNNGLGNYTAPHTQDENK